MIGRSDKAYHVTARETVDFNILSRNTRVRIMDHLASCIKCSTSFRWFLETSQAWEGEEGKKRLESFRKRLWLTLRFWLLGRRPAARPRQDSQVVIPITRRKKA